MARLLRLDGPLKLFKGPGYIDVSPYLDPAALAAGYQLSFKMVGMLFDDEEWTFDHLPLQTMNNQGVRVLEYDYCLGNAPVIRRLEFTLDDNHHLCLSASCNWVEEVRLLFVDISPL
jgi:hypothetical protein